LTRAFAAKFSDQRPDIGGNALHPYSVGEIIRADQDVHDPAPAQRIEAVENVFGTVCRNSTVGGGEPGEPLTPQGARGDAVPDEEHVHVRARKRIELTDVDAPEPSHHRLEQSIEQ
jgi:hypothetical protein